jgi:AAA domain
LVAIFMASTVSTGGNWPGAGTDIARRGDVIYITAKDNAADTIRPRLEAAGADLGRVHLVERISDVPKPRPFSVVDDLDRLDQWLQAVSEPRLLIIDPINACLSETDGRPFNSKSVSQGQVPSLLRSLNAIAIKHGVAIVCVTTTKIGGALFSVTDSFAYVAAAPSVFMVLHFEADRGKRVFTPDRFNLCNNDDVLAFRIEQRIVSNNISAPSAVFT